MKLPIIFFLTLFIISCSSKKTVSDAVIKKGVVLVDQENYQQAVDYFRSLLTSDIDDESKAVIYRNISIAYQSLGKLDLAKIYAKKSYLNAPDDSFEYYLNKADYELLSFHVSEALTNLNKAKELDSKRFEIYNRYCSIYSGEYGEVFFDPELAEKNALIACKIKPGRILKEQLGAIYFQNEKYTNSARIFNELVKRYPETKKYSFYYGQALYFNGDEYRGIQMMKDAAERDDSCMVMFEEIFENK
jgi:tetratricopeptide (TPR) repeat protein